MNIHFLISLVAEFATGFAVGALWQRARTRRLFRLEQELVSIEREKLAADRKALEAAVNNNQPKG